MRTLVKPFICFPVASCLRDSHHTSLCNHTAASRDLCPPPGEKQRGRDWSSVWKPLSLFPADGGRGCWKNQARTKLCLHPPGCLSSALARLSHTPGKDCSFSKLQLWTATPSQLQSKPGCERNWELQQSPQTTGLSKPRRITFSASASPGLMEVP